MRRRDLSQATAVIGAGLLALSIARSADAAGPWSFDVSKATIHEAWIGTDTVYLRLPYADRAPNQPIQATAALPPLTYPNKEGYQRGPLIAAIDVATGELRWARPC